MAPFEPRGLNIPHLLQQGLLARQILHSILGDDCEVEGDKAQKKIFSSYSLGIAFLAEGTLFSKFEQNRRHWSKYL